MGFVTKEQLERARQIPVLDYVMLYESDQFKRVGSSYRLRADDAFAVSKDGWYCHKRQIGSRTALDYLVEIKGYGLVEAVSSLIGERPYERGEKPHDALVNSPNAKLRIAPKPEMQSRPPPERVPFSLPLHNKDNKRVIAYLQSRGIDKEVILVCIAQGSLYQSGIWHNCVFTGKDENGKTRFAALRGTTSAFKCDADGSDKRYGFVLPPENLNSHKVAIFESPIDSLSHQTMSKQGLIPEFDGWRLSLGGTSDLALRHFLETHGEVNHCLICTDNDEAGNAVADKIATIPCITFERSLPIIGNDWNDALQAMQKAERTQGRMRQNNTLNL